MPSPTRSILLGALVSMVLLGLSGLPVLGVCLLCLGFLSPGLTTVWHYSTLAQGRLAARDGLRLGAQSGLLTFALLFLTATVLWLAQGRPDLVAPMLEEAGAGGGFADAIRDSGGDPDETMRQVEATMRSPLFGLFFAALWAALISLGGAIGGALGSGIFGRDVSPSDL
jgi:hypothetical protein